jgi:beta-N-acetylhexosaminidase
MNDLTTQLTLEQQIGQTLMVGFWGTTASQEIIDLIQKYHIGNVILFSRNIADAEQVHTLTATLQQAARDAGHILPLLIATDQENGIVQRLGTAATLFPGNMALGAINAQDAQKITFEVAQATGQEMAALGINMNLAPVVDVNNNAANSVIGVRSFGEDPHLVARLGSAAVQGYQGAGVIACMKHFPGHGDTSVDSHLALPTIPYDLARLQQLELVPFIAGIQTGVASIMVAHIHFPALDPSEVLPASLSSNVIQGLLRTQLAYQGLIISDCFEMRAVSETFGTERAAVMGLQAGNDIVLVSHHYEQQVGSINAIKTALHTGSLTPQVIQQAAQRVLALKSHYLSWHQAPPVDDFSISAGQPPISSIDTPAHQRLQERAYALTTTLVRNENALIPLHLQPADTIVIVSPPRNTMTIVEDRYYSDQSLLDIIRPYHEQTTLLPASSADDLPSLLANTDENAIFIITTINAHLDEAQASIVRSLAKQRQRIINIAARNPYDLQAYPSLPTYLATYEYTQPALQAALRVIFGEQKALGHVPVTIPDHRNNQN